MLESILQASEVTMAEFLICLGAAMLLGVLNAMVFTYKTRHSAGFALTLALLPMSVAVIIMLVNGNVGTGVAVAGAFALVRFRSAPGSAREIAAIFIAMGMGLALGMGYVTVAVIFFVCSAVMVLGLSSIQFGGRGEREKLLRITIPENYDYNGLFDDLLAQYTNAWRLSRVRTTNMGTMYELSYEIELKESIAPKEFMDELRTRNGNLTIVIGDIADKDVL